MMKPGELVVVVESVRDAVKFYTEKLSFDLVRLETQLEQDDEFTMTFAKVRKGKCCLSFRMPSIDELAEFSVIKRCSSRCINLTIELKKGIEKYFAKCNKKQINISGDIREASDRRSLSFLVRDPFGVKLQFIQYTTSVKRAVPGQFLDLPFKKTELTQTAAQNNFMEAMVARLKKIGVLRRAGKKYARQWLKQYC